MGCFVAPLTEAVVVTVAAVIVKQREKKHMDKSQNLAKEENKELPSSRLFRLVKLLFGGSVLLIFEHIWHGEVVPYFPFFTAVNDGPEAVGEMWHEILTAGISMAALCTAVWGVAEIIRYLFAKKASRKAVEE